VILVDTGALYALIDKNDINHPDARRFYEGVAGSESLAVSLPILTEAWLLVDARLGGYFANKLWQAALSDVFDILEIEGEDLKVALGIEKRYEKTGFGFVDATCFALCEKYKIRKVFTYDRKHFGIYKPSFSKSLDIVP
jgi:predicted nucleic acid-binding protein